MTKKKIYILFFIFAVILATSLAGCAPDAEPDEVAEPDVDEEPAEEPDEEVTDETFELDVATLFPDGNPITQEAVEGWADAVEEATDGRVSVTVYPGGTLLEGGEIYEGVVEGIVDVGHDPASYTPGRLPLLTAFQLGGIEFQSGEVISKVAWDIVKEGAVELEELDEVKVLWTYAISPGHLHTNRPVNTLEDLEGMEIRTAAPETIERLGATPVSMPMPEAYEALEKGIAEGLLSPLEALEGWRLAEVTDYTTFTPFLYSDLHLFTMNLDVWNSMPADIQEAIEEVNEQMHREVTSTLFDRIDESALEFMVEETGQETIELSEEEKERWIELLEPLHEEWIEEMEDQGLPGREMFETIIELSDKYHDELH